MRARGRHLVVGIAALCAALTGAAYAPAAVRSGTVPATGSKIYWGNNSVGKISEANLDGSGAGTDLITTGANVVNPTGTALDPATNTIYWTSAGNNKISYANLDGTGNGHDLTITGVTVDTPVGIAIDPAAGKIYWANSGASTISVANLDGSDAQDLSTTGVTPVNPQGIAIDPASNKIYWSNAGGNTISEANLDGTGAGSQLDTTGASAPDNPDGVAIDPPANKIYWANANDNKISAANLDGTGNGHDLTTTGASTPSVPGGVAIDPAVNKIYWADKGSAKISEANLDGTGNGQDIATTGATVQAPEYPALLEVPHGTAVPALSGGTTVGSTLTCSQGTWASDLLGAQLYRAPESFTYAWTLNGTAISSATETSFTTISGGTYACQVTAHNAAGATTQTSASFNVPSPAQSSPPSCTLTPSGARVTAVTPKHHRKPTSWTLKLKLKCNQPVNVKISGKIAATLKHKKHRSFKIAAVSASVSAGKSVSLTVKVPKAAVTALNGGARESATFTLTGTNANGTAHASAKIKRLKKPKKS